MGEARSREDVEDLIRRAHPLRDRVFGTTVVDGEGPDAGRALRIWFKNENHVTWRDERPWVMAPDLVMLLDAEDGTAYTNTLLPEGARVGVVGASADPKLRSGPALALLGPRHYGYDLAYAPIERLLGGRSWRSLATCWPR